MGSQLAGLPSPTIVSHPLIPILIFPLPVIRVPNCHRHYEIPEAFMSCKLQEGNNT